MSMHKVHARMIQQLVRENSRLRNENDVMVDQIDDLEKVCDNLRVTSAQCVIGIIRAAGDEFQDTPMDEETNDVVLRWLMSINPEVESIEDLHEELSQDNFINEDTTDDTYYSPTNRISHLFDDDDFIEDEDEDYAT